MAEPERDGVASAFEEADAWPAALRRVWRVEIGEPALSGHRLLVRAEETLLLFEVA